MRRDYFQSLSVFLLVELVFELRVSLHAFTAGTLLLEPCLQSTSNLFYLEDISLTRELNIHHVQFSPNLPELPIASLPSTMPGVL
jgi:hypothetical protein